MNHQRQWKPLRWEWTAMGSPWVVELEWASEDSSSDHPGEGVRDERDKKIQAMEESLGALLKEEVRRLEHAWSRYRPDSVVSQMNASGLKGERSEVLVDEETYEVLRFAKQCWEASEGCFDITSGVLRRVWDFKSGRVPTQKEIDGVRARIGSQWLELSEGEGRKSMRWLKEGMEMDLGGVGKEYAADRLHALIKQHPEGQRLRGWINAGGDIRVVEDELEGKAWWFGIQHPRQEGTVGGVSLKGGALTTSGDYERYMEVKGKRYSHIMNPKNGWPVQEWQSISVVAATCIEAGVMSTIGMVKGLRAKEWLKKQGVDAMGVQEGKIKVLSQVRQTLEDSEPAAASSRSLQPRMK